MIPDGTFKIVSYMSTHLLLPGAAGIVCVYRFHGNLFPPPFRFTLQ